MSHLIILRNPIDEGGLGIGSFETMGRTSYLFEIDLEKMHA
jgi:hypothetical protein